MMTPHKLILKYIAEHITIRDYNPLCATTNYFCYNGLRNWLTARGATTDEARTICWEVENVYGGYKGVYNMGFLNLFKNL